MEHIHVHVHFLSSVHACLHLSRLVIRTSSSSQRIRVGSSVPEKGTQHEHSISRWQIWKLVNLQDCVWENHCRLIMKTILQEMETIHCSITIWFTNLFLCLKAMKIPASKAAVDKEWGKLEKISAWNLTKVKSKKQVIDEARTKIRLPRHKWPKSWSSLEGPVVLLERNLYRHPLAGLLWERQFEKVLLKHGWEKVSNWKCFFVNREKGLVLSMYVDDIKLTGKKQIINPMWKLLNKKVDLGEPTSFLDHVYLGCTQ